jgi:putative ABC transport system permease protein
MLIWTTLKLAVKSLLNNKMRTFLSMLGIIIGVGSVISMLSLGEGARKQIVDRVSALGADLIIVRAGQRKSGGVRGTRAQTLVESDGQAVLNEIENVQLASPVVQTSGQFKNMNKNMNANILGVAPTYFEIRNYEIEKGRIFNDQDVERSGKVVVIGAEIAKQLYEDEEPLGKNIKISGINFIIIGVLKAKGEQGFYNPDEQAVIPYSTCMKKILGQDYLREIDFKISSGADQSKIQANIENLLKKRHKIPEEDEADFHVRNMAEMVETTSEVTGTFTLLLGCVAAISLLVGGIGIMNIMLVTVTERTREIGIRKAVGARNQDVLFQFLIEASLMSGTGGLIGAAGGITLARTVSKYSGIPALINPSYILISIGFSAAVGIFFGYYPALRAAALDPIDALSHE